MITILPLEAQAVKRALGLRAERAGSLTFYTGLVDGVSVACLMALGQGQRSTMAAYGNLVATYKPDTVVLVGIGGGIHPSVRIGDVVVSSEMVYYDLRRVSADGAQRRGETRIAPAGVGHAVNAFLTEHDPLLFEIADPTGNVRSVTLRSGPIGSGDAVIADETAAELSFLASFNDKILAVDMESGGLSQACHEQSAITGEPHRWAVVRGISDLANRHKNDEPQRIAAWHAAQILRLLLPYLRAEG